MSFLPLLLALVGGLLLLRVVLVFVCFIFSCIRAWYLESERLGFTPGSAISWLDKLLQSFDPSFLRPFISSPTKREYDFLPSKVVKLMWQIQSSKQVFHPWEVPPHCSLLLLRDPLPGRFVPQRLQG